MTADQKQRKIFRLRAEESHYNVRLKYYGSEELPDQILISEYPIFNPSKVEDADKWDEIIFTPKRSKENENQPEGDAPEENSVKEKGDYTRQSFLRAKRRAYDLVRCNDFDCFVTLTMDKKVVDRENYDEIVKKLGVWLDNRVRRKGLKYVLCPEYHKDGKAIHFHGLMNSEALKLIDSKRKRHKKTVYNVDDFPLGFSTAMKVTGEESKKATAGYVFKYMTKQGANNKIGGRYFLHGGDLEKPRYEYVFIDDYENIDAYEFPIKGAEGTMKCFKGEKVKEFLGISANKNVDKPTWCGATRDEWAELNEGAIKL